MQITKITLSKSPFDSSYNNVPSDFQGVREKGAVFTEEFYQWIVDKTSTTTVTEIKADAFAGNINESIVIRIADIEAIRDKNYCIVSTEAGNKFYFIVNYTLLNAMSTPSIKLNLVMDIWVTCYETAVRQDNAVFAITHQHLNMIASDGGASMMYQNIVNEPIQTVTEWKMWGTPRVLWAVYKCDPTVTFYTDRSNNHPIGNYGPNPTYGTYKYFYYPVGLIRKGYIEPIGRIWDSSYSLYFPRIQGSYLLSQQLTTHVPFEYTLSARDAGGYNVNGAVAHNPIFYLYGTTEYKSIDAWGADYDRNEFTEFYYYNEDTVTTVNTTHYQYTVDNGQSGDRYNSLDEIQYSPYMKAYPFNYYTLQLPNGKDIEFTQVSPLDSIDIHVTPTDSGGRVTINAVTVDGNSVMIGDETFVSYEVTGDVPKTVSAYLDYMSRSGTTLNEERRYALQKANYNATVGTLSGITEVAIGAAKLAGVAATGGTSAAVTGAGVTELVNGTYKTITASSVHNIEKQHIEQAYNSRMADLSTTTVTRFSASNQLNSAPFWDMPVIFNHTVVNNDVNRMQQLSFIKYGTACNRVGNPLEDYRKYFNYVQAVNPNFTSIGNSVFRRTFNDILTEGTTKWDIRRYKSDVLDWFVDNQQN